MSVLVEVYDLESLSNLFTYTGYCRQEDKYYQFVIHKSLNQYAELMQHIRRGRLVMVGFNNLNYDYPLLHHLINHYDEYIHLTGSELAQKIYQKSQEIIDMEYSAIADKNTYIPQIDVFKVNHWDNPAKATSLKHCEMVMRMDNIEEMPLHHTHWVTKQEEIDMILNYNKHDVKATNILYDYVLGKTTHTCYKGRNKIELRQLLGRTYSMNLLNHSDVKMGEDILLKLYSKKVGVPEYMIKKLRTPRSCIHLKDCIPSYINFKSKQFTDLKNKWVKTTVTTTKNALKDSIIYHGIKLEYGLGGVHGSNSGVFIEDDYWMIKDSDVGLK